MTSSPSSKWKAIWISAAVVVVGVGGFYTVAAMTDRAPRDLASGDTTRVLDALATMDKDALSDERNQQLRRKAFETLKGAPLEQVFDRLHSDDLTDAQREHLEDNLRQLMREDMERKVNEYFAATTDQERDRILDQHIDDFKRFRERMRAYREKIKDDPKRQADADRRRSRRWAPSKQQRKDRMENTSPDRRARMFQYFMKMRARAEKRGEDMGGPFGHRRAGSGGQRDGKGTSRP